MCFFIFLSIVYYVLFFFFFFFNDTATTEIYTLSLHDALPILILDIFARRARTREGKLQVELAQLNYLLPRLAGRGVELSRRSEEHTSELQSLAYLVCRLLLEKKKKINKQAYRTIIYRSGTHNR